MTLQYNRGARVTIYKPRGFFDEPGTNAIIVEGGEDSGMRVAFSIEKSLGKDPNKCEITISNLAERTRDAVAKTPLAVVLHAGYDGERKRLFYGDVRWANSEKEGPTWNTTILVGDGDRAYRHGRVTRSYRAGAKVRDAVRDAARAMGLELPRELEVSADLDRQFGAGDTLVGPARDELTRLLEPYGYHWSVQDGHLIVLRDGDARTGEVWPVNEDEGMINRPSYAQPDKAKKPPKLSVQTKLYPELSPGCLVRVSSRKISGTFRVESLAHDGDTGGEEWTTSITATPRTSSTGSSTSGGRSSGGGAGSSF